MLRDEGHPQTRRSQENDLLDTKAVQSPWPSKWSACLSKVQEVMYHSLEILVLGRPCTSKDVRDARNLSTLPLRR